MQDLTPSGRNRPETRDLLLCADPRSQFDEILVSYFAHPCCSFRRSRYGAQFDINLFVDATKGDRRPALVLSRVWASMRMQPSLHYRSCIEVTTSDLDAHRFAVPSTSPAPICPLASSLITSCRSSGVGDMLITTFDTILALALGTAGKHPRSSKELH